MSWSSFKKTMARSTTQIMQKAGAVDKTVDRSFDEEEKRIKNLQGKAEKLQKEAKGYLNALRAMTGAQVRIAETIEQLYEEQNDGRDLAGSRYKDAIDQFENESKIILDEPYRHTVLDPINRFCAYFPDINEAVKKRHKKLLDYDAQRAKVRKLVDKPSDDPQKLPRAEQDANLAHEMYESLNTQLVRELPQLIDLRVPYFDPTFEAMIKIQLKFCQEGYHRLNEVNENFADDRAVDGKVEEVLQQMRDLTICGMG